MTSQRQAPSPRVLQFLRDDSAIRRPHLSGSEKDLIVLLEGKGLPAAKPWCEFEAEYGGLQGSYGSFGLLVMSQNESYPHPIAVERGFVCIGRYAGQRFFMAPDGTVYRTERQQLEPAADDARTMFEKLAIYLEVERRAGALQVVVAGVSAPALAKATSAKSVTAAADRTSTLWELPKRRGFIEELSSRPHEVKIHAPSVRAACRALATAAELGATAALVLPWRIENVLRKTSEAPTDFGSPSGELRHLFAPMESERLRHRLRVVQKGEDAYLEQLTRLGDGSVLAQSLLRDGGYRRDVFMGLEAHDLGMLPSNVASKIAGHGACRDPLMHGPDSSSLTQALFQRGYAMFEALETFESAFGGISFWADFPVQLGTYGMLKTDPIGLLAGEVGQRDRVPVAEYADRVWLLASDGAIHAHVEEGDMGQIELASTHPNAVAFLTALGSRAEPWRRFPYGVLA